MSHSLLYQIALTLIPNIGPVQARILLQHYNVDELFRARKSSLEKIEGIGAIRASSITAFDRFRDAEDEMAFIEKYRITPLFITDAGYPKRLLNCYDSPALLYYRGEANLNTGRIIAVIGTRSHTEYGKQLTEKIIQDLQGTGILVVSGLAYGIDVIAHKSAVKNDLPTVGVLAHGLDQIYPPQHAGLAKDMVNHGGGLLTEFRSKSIPDKHNFPIRNRIVAGMSDATIVVESGVKGGSIITAELANSYNKDVFAFPGRVTDHKSAGCNYLIKNNKAVLLNDARDLLAWMRWDEKPAKANAKIQKQLFVDLTAEERIILDILQEKDMVPIDELHFKSGLSSSAVAAAILHLELENIISSLPGKLYKLL